jgi:hypothetical protein
MKTFYNEALEQDTKALMITLDGLFFTKWSIIFPLQLVET